MVVPRHHNECNSNELLLLFDRFMDWKWTYGWTTNIALHIKMLTPACDNIGQCHRLSSSPLVSSIMNATWIIAGTILLCLCKVKQQAMGTFLIFHTCGIKVERATAERHMVWIYFFRYDSFTLLLVPLLSVTLSFYRTWKLSSSIAYLVLTINIDSYSQWFA